MKSPIQDTRCLGQHSKYKTEALPIEPTCSNNNNNSLWALQPMMNLGLCFTVSQSCRQSVGLLGRGISPPQGRYLHRKTQAQNKRRKTSMAGVGSEPPTPVFEQANIVHALDGAATLIGALTSIWNMNPVGKMRMILSCACVWLQTGFGLEIGFIDHLYTQLGTTSNYSAITDLHTLRITTAEAKPCLSAVSSPVVPW
jgi:hypothetical protein